jgi:hypothetical protein
VAVTDAKEITANKAAIEIIDWTKRFMISFLLSEHLVSEVNAGIWGTLGVSSNSTVSAKRTTGLGSSYGAFIPPIVSISCRSQKCRVIEKRKTHLAAHEIYFRDRGAPKNTEGCKNLKSAIQYECRHVA